MKRGQYIRMVGGLKEKPMLLKLLTILNKVGPWVYGILYALLLVAVARYSVLGLARVFLVPVGSFLIIHLTSMFLDYPRPYEKFGVNPAIPEDRADGHSLPCKPAFWYAIIGLTYLFVLANPLPGVLLLLGAAVLSGIRIWGGLHFTRDVIAGIVLAIVFGLIGLMG
jgi:phosphatidylglycerophosphatase B